MKIFDWNLPHDGPVIEAGPVFSKWPSVDPKLSNTGAMKAALHYSVSHVQVDKQSALQL